MVVKGRNVEVPEHYRQHVAEKVAKVERYDPKIIRLDVELSHERNPRQSDQCQRVELTCASRGPVVRAEASAGDFYSALDVAIGKLEARLRRSADRRRVHRGRRTPVSVAEATAGVARRLEDEQAVLDALDPGDDELDEAAAPWRVVREKEHVGEPMTLEDALFQMELVGHDFFLFLDKESGKPSVVYRRKAYDYGVIALAI